MTNHPKRRTSGLGLTEADAATARDLLAATSAYIASVTQLMARQIKEAGGNSLPALSFRLPPLTSSINRFSALSKNMCSSG
jgi:hypothetical protein